MHEPAPVHAGSLMQESLVQALAAVTADGGLAVCEALQADLWEETAESVGLSSAPVPQLHPAILSLSILKQHAARWTRLGSCVTCTELAAVQIGDVPTCDMMLSMHHAVDDISCRHVPGTEMNVEWRVAKTTQSAC